MDLICSRCGEPWEVYYVLHEEPDDFERDGSLITHCPACEESGHPVNEKRAFIAGAIADIMGDDIDGAAAEMEDMERWLDAVD